MRLLACALLLVAMLPNYSTERQYRNLTSAMHDAAQLAQNGDFRSALPQYQYCHDRLLEFRTEHPAFEPASASTSLFECEAKIKELVSKVPQHTPYPWKSNIATEVFTLSDVSLAARWNAPWKGDNPNGNTGMSVFDSNVLSQSPFYVGLPFNDLDHPATAKKWLPALWLSPTLESNPKPVSACQDRWIEIQLPTGRACFAQWEAPTTSEANDGAYVFGSARPQDKIGLRISPAVAEYLGIYPDHPPALVAWRFVDDDDVRPGMWIRYEEQSLLLRATRQPTDSLSPAAP